MDKRKPTLETMGLIIDNQTPIASSKFWKNKTVLVTGHTGFKGSWLCLWLLQLGAKVVGYSLPPSPGSLYENLNLPSCITDNHYGDIRDFSALSSWVSFIKPDIVFHLAAQPLVRYSYNYPRETWEVNVSGTVNLLESVRLIENKCAVVVIATDKVYLNKEWQYGYRELDPLGGYDPYSSSKAAVEIAVDSWRSSFMTSSSRSNKCHLASARAGNVIGGGDWAQDRIIPDLVRAFQQSKPLIVRNPLATRPWQHVLDPLNGYLSLAQQLYQSPSFAQAYNFGPLPSSQRNVADLVTAASSIIPINFSFLEIESSLHEATLLHLSIDKAVHDLSWSPKWDFTTTISKTINWYKAVLEGSLSQHEACLNDLIAFSS